MQFYTFKPITDFYYSIGKARTDVPWFRPDPEYLNRWKEEFFKIEEASKYRYFFHGGARHNPRDTWDVDIAMTGPAEEKDYPTLEYIMYMMRQLGFKNRQLIQPFWQDTPPEIYLRPPCKHFEIACEAHMEKGSCTLKECMENPAGQFTEAKRIRYGRFIVKNNIEQHVLNPNDGPEVETVRVGELIVTNILQPNLVWPQKIAEKMKNGFYKKSPLEITPDINFREFMSWP